jgi:Fe-S oxidoreductase
MSPESSMSAREGSLEAPTRHPIAWKSPEFWNELLLEAELERVFDICHGCRRCVSLCNAFPTLFDLIDESASGEVDGVAKADYGKVVDQCYLCDVCYMTKCPYVPPHPWNLDFPHLMLRAKAVQFRKGTPTHFRDNTLASTDRNGKFATIPVVVQIVNKVNQVPAFRRQLEAHLGVAADAWLPHFASKPFLPNAAESPKHPVVDGARSKGKVAVYSTCYINYNEPGIGHDLLKILDHNAIPYQVVQKVACCGMPKLELGDLNAVEEAKNRNIPALARLARDGWTIVTPIPSCTLMFKQELPLLFPDDADVLAVRDAMRDPFDYLVSRHKDGLLKSDYKEGLGRVAYHVACHLRVQNVGQKTREILAGVPGTTVHTVERCSGHAGTWGVKKEFHQTALKIGRPAFRQLSEHPDGEPDWIASDCQLAGRHIEEGLQGKAKDRIAHPLSLMARAYGL